MVRIKGDGGRFLILLYQWPWVFSSQYGISLDTESRIFELVGLHWNVPSHIRYGWSYGSYPNLKPSLPTILSFGSKKEEENQRTDFGIVLILYQRVRMYYSSGVSLIVIGLRGKEPLLSHMDPQLEFSAQKWLSLLSFWSSVSIRIGPN